MKTPHEWMPSRLWFPHGEWQCGFCLATDREIAAIGDPDHCPKRAAWESEIRDHVAGNLDRHNI